MKAKGLVVSTVLTSAISLMSARALASAPPTASAPILSTTSLSDLNFPDMWYVPHLDLGGYYFKNDPKGAGLVNLFLPVYQTADQLSFAQLRSYSKNSGSWEGNASFGYRHLSHNEQTMWGVAVSYDHLGTGSGNVFNQASLNGVMWHKRWTVNGNVYIPFGTTNQRNVGAQLTELKSAGAYKNIYYAVGLEQAMRGMDLSVGNNVWKGLTVNGGLYYYQHSNVPTIFGPEMNANYTWYAPQSHKIAGLFDRISLQAQVQHDKPRGTNAYAGVTVSILLPGDKSDLTGVARHMIDPINRDLDVTTESYHTPLQLLKNAAGRAINVKDVSNKTQLEQALADPNADVIAVNGVISGLDDEDISRSLYLTGGNYDFTRDGEGFSAKVASNGGLKAAAGDDLLQLTGDGANRLVTIQDLGLDVDANSGDRVIYNADNTENFGTINLIGDTGNGRVVFGLNGAGLIGTVNLQGNNFNAGGWSDADTIGNFGAVEFDAQDGAHLTVSDFRDNTVVTSGIAKAFETYADGAGSSIVFSHDVTNNTITSSDSTGNTDSNAMEITESNNASVVFQGDFSNNTLDAAYGAFFDNIFSGSTLQFKGSIDNNTMTGRAYGFYNRADGANSAIIFDGNIDSNHINATDAYFGDTGLFFYADTAGSITLNGSLERNVIFGGDEAFAFDSEDAGSQLLIKGDLAYNHFLSQGGGDQTRVAALFTNGGTLNIEKGIHDNAFDMSTSSVNNTGLDIEADGSNLTVNGLYNNAFNANANQRAAFSFTAVNNGILTVNVNDPQHRGLSAANGGATIEKLGTTDDIHINKSKSSVGGAFAKVARLFKHLV